MSYPDNNIINTEYTFLQNQRYTQCKIAYKEGQTEYYLDTDVNDPPDYSDSLEKEAWQMGWRSAEYSDACEQGYN